MKCIKNIKLLMLVGLLLQVRIDFARWSDCEAQGESISAALNAFHAIPVSKLIEAVRKGNLEDAKNALNNPDMNVNELDKHNRTALMYAVEMGRKDMVGLLVDKGADPHIWTWNDKTALREAVKNGDKDSVRLFLAKGIDANVALCSKGYALLEAANKGYQDIAELLLDNGANPNSTGVSSNAGCFPTTHTPLLEAAGNGHKNIVRLLLNKGVDVNAQSSTTNNTALMEALLRGHKDIAKLLLDNGANPHIPDVHGNTALKVAKINGYLDIVQQIVNRK